MAAYDLHIHSGYSSDGELPVAAIVGLCAARGLDAFSLTDHNSVRGVGEAARLARERNITSALLDLGQSTIQTVGAKPDGSAWRIGIQDPQGEGTARSERN